MWSYCYHQLLLLAVQKGEAVHSAGDSKQAIGQLLLVAELRSLAGFEEKPEELLPTLHPHSR
jgi:hypothetical protein